MTKLFRIAETPSTVELTSMTISDGDTVTDREGKADALRQGYVQHFGSHAVSENSSTVGRLVAPRDPACPFNGVVYIS